MKQFFPALCLTALLSFSACSMMNKDGKDVKPQAVEAAPVELAPQAAEATPAAEAPVADVQTEQALHDGQPK
jgi:hypothetical protein